MINILITKLIDCSLFPTEYFSIQCHNFLSIEYKKLYKKPILNNHLIFTSYNGAKGFLYNFKNFSFRKKIYVVGEKAFFLLKKHFPCCLFLKKNYLEVPFNQAYIK